MDPGTALAVVSLSFQVFGGCVQGFMLICKARNLGKDASLLRSLLSLQEYRFIQWAKAVDLLRDEGEFDDKHDNRNQAASGNVIPDTKASALTSKPMLRLTSFSQSRSTRG